MDTKRITICFVVSNHIGSFSLFVYIYVSYNLHVLLLQLTYIIVTTIQITNLIN